MAEEKRNEGIIVVISGPSGSGKGTVMGYLKEIYPEAGLAVSATTRPMRDYEAEGREYFFKTREEFERLLAEGEILEHTVYNGNLYGTLKSEADRILGEGLDLLLEIEVDGAS
ncbi:guanylate kinase, partial [Vibrio sp. FNV 38]|nr:guanylate kinase [Vibrio sp. FNV 38]